MASAAAAATAAAPPAAGTETDTETGTGTDTDAEIGTGTGAAGAETGGAGIGIGIGIRAEPGAGAEVATPPSLAAFGVSMTDVLVAVRERVDDFAGLPLAAFAVAPLSGGMSNLMFTVSAVPAGVAGGGCEGGADGTPVAAAGGEGSGLAPSPQAPLRTPVVRRVVARILSPQLDTIIDRLTEHQIVSYLSTTGIGPRLFGTAAIRPADGGPSLLLRIEEFIDGRTLTVGDLRHNVAAGQSMARKVARLHAQRPHLRRHESYPDVEPADFPVPVPLPHSCGVENTLAATLHRYVLLADAIGSVVRGGSPPPPGTLAGELAALLATTDWGPEVEWLLRLLAAHGGPTVLAHCDLQEGNWIQCTATGKLYMIDYEYACYNYRGFDLGNLFCEHTFDYACSTPPGYVHELAYPALHWQRAILAQYATQAAAVAAASAGRGGSGGGGGTVQAPRYDSLPDLAALGVGDEALRSADAPRDARAARERTTLAPAALAAAFPEAAVRELATQARVGILASHLYWALWSIVMGAGKLGIAPRPTPPPPDATAAAAAPSSPVRLERRSTSASPPPQVATGHSVFNYFHYGVTRASEYARLKAELLEDCPSWGGSRPAAT